MDSTVGTAGPVSRLKVLFLVEGTTDIRFVAGLSEISALTLALPAALFHASGLAERIRAAKLDVRVDEIPGGRLAYQARSLAYLWRRIRDFDVVVSQEVLRGSLNATVVGQLRGVPVLTYLAISPREYFRCRYERGMIGRAGWLAGDALIAMLMEINGRCATAWLALGPYLASVARAYTPRVGPARYYGVDTNIYRPVDDARRLAIRRRLGIPEHAFVVFAPSRNSHEKDPETVIRAALAARQGGTDVVLINTAGDHAAFAAAARGEGVPPDAPWLMARPAVHPVTELADYYHAADVVALASLAEGLGLSALEALACGTPVVATAVGGLATHPAGLVRLTPRRDAPAMAAAFADIERDPVRARAMALEGRAYVEREWRRDHAFAELGQALARARSGGTWT